MDLKKRITDAKSKLEQLQHDLMKLQDKFRRDPSNAALRAELNEAKKGIAVASEEHAELARAHSLAQGGTNHRPLP